MKTILVLSANPDGSVALELERELRTIRSSLERSRNRFKLEHRAKVQWKDFWRSIEDVKPEIVHFSGHGVGEKGLCVEEEDGTMRLVSADALSRMFKLFSCVECVVLSACYSQDQAIEIRRHVPYVVGMSLSVGDRAARDFAEAFYDGLVAGRDYQGAFDHGLMGMANDGEVWTPVLLRREPIDSPVEQPTSIVRFSTVNPFTYGTPLSVECFYGRKQEVKFLVDRLQKRTCVNIVGPRGSGKTLLLKYILANQSTLLPNPEKTILVSLDLSACVAPRQVVEGLRRGITKNMGKSPWLKEDNDDHWAVQEGLEDVKDRGFNIGIFLDEFDALKYRLDLFEDWGNDWRSKASVNELFTLIVASQRPLSEFYCNNHWSSPFDNIFNQIYLGSMESNVWRELVQHKLGNADPVHLDWIEEMAGGMPYYVNLAAASLWECDFDIVAAKRHFSRQAEQRFSMLWRDLNDLERSTLHLIVSLDDPELSQGIFNRLVLYGLVRQEGGVFSLAFKEWIVGHGETS